MERVLEQSMAERPYRKPVGMRVIGHQDPRRLTFRDFCLSPDRVYHAARTAFELDPFLDYDATSVFETTVVGDGGMTLGAGLYTTPDEREAQNYLLKRGGGHEGSRLYTLVPYRARVLDLREASDPENNGHVPGELVKEWTQLVEGAYKRLQHKLRQQEKLSFGDEMDLDWWQQYLARLNVIQQNGRTYNLRTILGTGDTAEAKRELPPMVSAAAPPWITLWTRFMLYKGIDGVIYHEGSEVEAGKNSANVVFYNLAKVGTYASWHRERGHGVI